MSKHPLKELVKVYFSKRMFIISTAAFSASSSVSLQASSTFLFLVL